MRSVLAFGWLAIVVLGLGVVFGWAFLALAAGLILGKVLRRRRRELPRKVGS